MKRFTNLVESIESEKYFKVTANVELSIKAENEGEAGYIADSDLASIETHSEYSILEIDEISKEEYNKSMLIESYGLQIGDLPKESTSEEKIISTWESEFGSRTPTATEKMEFYHHMREAGFDGQIIINSLSNRISSKWMRKKL